MATRHPLLAQAIALSEAGRNPEAVVLISRLAAQNDPEALHMLAEMNWRGGMVPQNFGRARELYRRAGEAGHLGAAACYTNLLASGIGGERDWPRAVERLRKEAKSDSRRRAAIDLIDKMRLTSSGDPEALTPAERLSTSPDVLLFPRLLTAGECDFVRDVGEAVSYQPSVVQTGGRVSPDPIRTSHGSSIHWLVENPAIHAINRRFAAAAALPVENGESLQILRYRPGQQYRAHLDAIGDPNERIATVLTYLNHDYAGGETCFLKTGLKIAGRKGQAIVFRNIDSERRLDRMAEHAGLPVTRGSKYLASRWIRERRWTPA